MVNLQQVCFLIESGSQSAFLLYNLSHWTLKANFWRQKIQKEKQEFSQVYFFVLVWQTAYFFPSKWVLKALAVLLFIFIYCRQCKIWSNLHLTDNIDPKRSEPIQTVTKQVKLCLHYLSNVQREILYYSGQNEITVRGKNRSCQNNTYSKQTKLKNSLAARSLLAPILI